VRRHRVDAQQRRHGLSFDEVPTLYDRYRPDYPDEVIDDLVALAGCAPGESVLEIGAGTGKATMAMVARGLRITAIEPAPRMAAMLARKLQGHDGARVVIARFEDVELAGSRFQLVMSAMAFHWIDPTVGYARAAVLLAPEGRFGLIRTDHVSGPASAEYFRLVRPIYEREAPELARRIVIPPAEDVPECPDGIESGGLFAIDAQRRYLWDQPYAADAFVGLLRTYSDHRALPRERRARLLAGVRSVIDDRLGGTITTHYLTTLCVARRRDSSAEPHRYM
jgi:ubiquinone/menaquinone biosynthesis C-methylase UbiE